MDDYLSQANELYDRIQAQYDANNAWSAEQAQKAMDYQTEMSNTAHQREVADLKAAGLNPVLSAGGSGATTGSGIQAQRSDSNVEALYGLVSKAFEANIKQAEMMAATAKSAGSGSGVGLDIPIGDVNDSELAIDIAADFFKRKYGIDPEKTKEAIKRFPSLWEEIFPHTNEVSQVKSAGVSTYKNKFYQPYYNVKVLIDSIADINNKHKKEQKKGNYNPSVVSKT